MTALMGCCALSKFLLDKGAEVNVRSATGVTPLHCTAMRGFGEVVEIFPARGAQVNIRGSSR